MSPRAGLGIRHKLFLVFLALVLAPFLIYTTIALRQSSRNAERTARYSARQALLQARQFIESRQEAVNRALTYIRLDPQVTALCAADPSLYRADLSRWNDDATALRRIVLTFGQSNPDLAESLRLRNPYIDPMSLIQIELLRRKRAGKGSEQLDYLLAATIHGVAAGLRNTG